MQIKARSRMRLETHGTHPVTIPGQAGRFQIYTDGESSYQHTLQTNAVYGGADVKAYAPARLSGDKTDGQSDTQRARP